MTTHGWRDDVVVLAGTREVRVVASMSDAERELASGFRPGVVLLGSRVGGPGVADFARRMGADPEGAIPVLSMSDEAGWIRITPLDDDLQPPGEPDALRNLLQVLEDLCSEPLLLAS
jgi:hypothetical protein